MCHQPQLSLDTLFTLQEKDAQCVYGLLLYSLDRLYHAVERHARATGEWQWLVSDRHIYILLLYFNAVISCAF